MSETSSLELRQIVDAIFRSIPLDGAKLTDDFFPAHLSIALIDAVFRSRLRNGERPAPVAQRYCRHFGSHGRGGPMGDRPRRMTRRRWET